MFLASTSISEKVGAHEFNGFLLDMNRLFEEFVQQAFISVVRYTTASAGIQKPEPLSMNPVAPIIKPDVTIREGAAVVSIVDAKYKRDAAGPQNPDIYQVVTYGTVLKCSRTYLMYPHTELDTEHDFRILNSPIIVHIRRINISIPDCVRAAETIAREIVTESQRHEESALMPEDGDQKRLASAL
jgi:5-methylcytosine-specific restriction endonuclease McrBC regulatory subunit McrC